MWFQRQNSTLYIYLRNILTPNHSVNKSQALWQLQEAQYWRGPCLSLAGTAVLVRGTYSVTNYTCLVGCGPWHQEIQAAESMWWGLTWSGPEWRHVLAVPTPQGRHLSPIAHMSHHIWPHFLRSNSHPSVVHWHISFLTLVDIMLNITYAALN